MPLLEVCLPTDLRFSAEIAVLKPRTAEHSFYRFSTFSPTRNFRGATKREYFMLPLKKQVKPRTVPKLFQVFQNEMWVSKLSLKSYGSSTASGAGSNAAEILVNTYSAWNPAHVSILIHEFLWATWGTWLGRKGEQDKQLTAHEGKNSPQFALPSNSQILVAGFWDQPENCTAPSLYSPLNIFSLLRRRDRFTEPKTYQTVLHSQNNVRGEDGGWLLTAGSPAFVSMWGISRNVPPNRHMPTKQSTPLQLLLISHRPIGKSQPRGQGLGELWSLNYPLRPTDVFPTR